MYSTPYGNYNNYRRFQPPTNQQTFLNRTSTRNHAKLCITCGQPVSCTQIFYCSDCCYCKACAHHKSVGFPPPKIQTKNAPTPLPIEILDQETEDELDHALSLAENSSKKLGREIKKLKRTSAAIGHDLLFPDKKKVKLEICPKCPCPLKPGDLYCDQCTSDLAKSHPVYDDVLTDEQRLRQPCSLCATDSLHSRRDHHYEILGPIKDLSSSWNSNKFYVQKSTSSPKV